MQNAIWIVSTTLLLAACGNKTQFAGSAEGVLDATNNQITIKQIDREAYDDEFTQGHTGQNVSEEFAQGESFGTLDLQVVIDNSGSMDAEQANLSGKLEPLLAHIDRSDWRINVTTTDKDEPCQRKLITRNDPNKLSDFADAINAGITGSGYEVGLYKAVEGLKCQSQPWTRLSSAMAVLIVSDEDNCSSRAKAECDGTNSLEPEYLLDYLSAIRNVGKNARVYGIIAHPSVSCPTALNTSTIYADVIAQTNGKWGSICDNDYTSTLTAISQDLAGILETRFYLESPPVDNSVIVKVDGVLYSTDYYRIENHMIVFTKAPAKDAKVTIEYETLETTLKNTFKLEHTVSVGTVLVFVNDVEVPSDKFLIDTINQRLVFDEAPEDKAIIRVEYREEVELPKTFEIEKGLKGKSLQVRIDNEPVEDFGYDPRTGILEFAVAPADGATIIVAFD